MLFCRDHSVLLISPGSAAAAPLTDKHMGSTGFFSQFGVVTRVRVSRNKRTGKCKHYAFVEFYLPEVAAIAAEAMDGYMMFAQKLKVEVIPRSRQHPALMRGSKKPFKVSTARSWLLPTGQLQAPEPGNRCLQ